MSVLKIYGSSAGSGKTFTLARTYLSLLLQSEKPDYFKNILAITFTNDAATEMKERILDTLREIGGDQENYSSKTATMLAAIREDTGGMEPVEIQKRAAAAFDEILQNYADFNVKTIDSFVNQLVSSFSRDLGLPYNYEILLDKEPVLLKAAERVFDKIGLPEYDYITDLVQRFAEEQANEGKSWQNLLPNLASFARNLFDDQHFNLIQKNEELKHQDYLQIKKNIDQYLGVVKAHLKTLSKEGFDLLEQKSIQIDDFAFGKSGFGGFFLKIQEDDGDFINSDWQPGKRILAAIEDDNWYSQKAASDTKAKIDLAADEIRDFYLKTAAFADHERPKYILLKEIRNSLNNLALLDEVHQEFGIILSENNQAYITDFNRRIQAVITEEPVPYIFERIGEKFNHILIDEFQDTSDLQYFNLLPLIENALAKGYFNMLVGDPKQSIYRFRGGKVELMLHLLHNNTGALKENPMLSDHQRFAIDYTNSYLTKENLDKNYRSKQEIIEFNRKFFEQIIETNEELMIKEAFENAAQETHPGTKKGGHVEFLLNESKDVDKDEWTFRQVIGKIEEALNAGFSYGDIAILCREKKKEAAPVANYLLSQGYPIISSDSLLLKNNQAVSLLISLMKAYRDEMYSPEAILLYHKYKQIPFPKEMPNKNIWHFLGDQGILIDLHLMNAFGLYQLAESLASKLGLFEDKASLPFLFALFDLIQNQVKNNGNSLSDFLSYWQQSGSGSSVSISKPEAITVTTIHKSKGLEYPVVIMPYCNWSTVNRTGSKTWVDLEEIDWPELSHGDKRLLSGNTGFKKDLNITPVGPQIAKELEFIKLEALNILYVAFTRPVDRLYILATKTGNNTIYPYITGFIGDIQANEEEIIHHILYQGIDSEKVQQSADEKSFIIDKIPSRDNLGNLKIKSSIDKLFNEENQRDRGNLIHTLFSHIQLAEDLDQALRQLQFDGLISENEKPELKDEAIKIMEHPQLKHLFSGNIKVENERDILLRNQDFSRPDRVVLQGDKVSIIDYKTGQKRKSHLNQIKHYGELYHMMGYTEVEMLLVYLNPTEVISVRA
ncbi:exodeoxyribonuclease V subunit beta [Jiulongibacter sediminis]|uniref:UvrD-helicase domain-containing protein n=1 Tax=Jiulongibacter sediminis TaxID=1605367 RepID=UPI0026EFE902|nr:UvrD-helicase domain-containing protein [Jiulongibacter sediminis]